MVLCCSVLQCVAVCCSVLQCVAVMRGEAHGIVLQYVAPCVCCSVALRAAVCVLQYVAVCVAVCCSVCVAACE